MKKLLFLGILLSVLCAGCEKDEVDYAGLLLGTWVNTQVNSVPVLTDASWVMELRADGIEFYAEGHQIDEDNKTWEENDQYNYSIEGKTLLIDGTDMLDRIFHMEFVIQSVNQTTLIYSVKYFSIDDVEYPDSKVYTCRKATADYSNQFTGIWYGHCITPGTSDTGYHYWEYFEDGSFNYYYQDEEQNWIRKSDNEGGYFLYGNLFVSNYSNDLISGGTGKAYECWHIEIIGDNMIWTGLRTGNQTITYLMEKVASPPDL